MTFDVVWKLLKYKVGLTCPAPTVQYSTVQYSTVVKLVKIVNFVKSLSKIV